MKALFLFLTICFSCSVSAQTWAPFPLDETSEWRVENTWLTGEECVITEHYNYYVSGQQTHEGNEYHEISYDGIRWSQAAMPPDPPCITWPPIPISGVRGLLRAEEGKIYQASTNGEFVLYDFTMEVGDTVQGFNTTFRVDSIDQLLVNDDPCKRFWVVEGIWQGFSDQPIWIVENVGHQHGLFESMYQFENSSNLCYRENGTPLVYNPFSQACSITSIEDEQIDKMLVSPNPTTGIFRIETPQKSTYRIYDLFGRMIKQGQTTGASEIDLSSAPSGIYLISVENEKGVSTSKLLKQ
ncbi:MAG: hypothetical protein ACI85F_003031 [Bacteroidia bacterium]|jgi:hypothetical protein